MLYPILFFLIILAVAAMFAVRQRSKETAAVDQRDSVLQALAPIVSGTVGDDHVLGGTYRGESVRVALGYASAMPAQPESGHQQMVEVIRLEIGGDGGHPWHVRATPHLLHPTAHDLDFVHEGGAIAHKLQHMTGMPGPDPDLEQRLRDAGLMDAVEALGRPSNTWLPSVQFTPDFARVAGERARAGGMQMPAGARERSGLPFGGLTIEVERSGDADPSPQSFQELLDAALRITQVNAQVNPV